MNESSHFISVERRLCLHCVCIAFALGLRYVSLGIVSFGIACPLLLHVKGHLKTSHFFLNVMSFVKGAGGYTGIRMETQIALFIHALYIQATYVYIQCP